MPNLIAFHKYHTVKLRNHNPLIIANMQLLKMYITVSFFLAIIALVATNALTAFDNGSGYDNSAFDCIDTLVRKFIRCGTFLTVIDTTNLTNRLIKSLSDDYCYSFISRSMKRKRWPQKPVVYIISTVNSDQLTVSIKKLANELWWNPRAKFIITIDDLEKEEILYIFEMLFIENIFDVFLIEKGKRDVAKVYSYSPFENNSCGKVTNDVISIEACVDTLDINLKDLTSKLSGCSIIVAAGEDMVHVIFKNNKEFSYLGQNLEGIEQYMLHNIAKLKNITIKYILVGRDLRYGNVLPNRTATGVLSYLQDNTANVAGGGFVLITNRFELFDIIWGYNYANIYVFAPSPGEENWKKVYEEFSSTTWVLIIVSFFFTTLVIGVVRRILLGKEDNILLVLKIWGYLYGRTDIELFRVKKMRIIIIIWIWFTYFIANIYNTAFSSLLTSKHVEKTRTLPKDFKSLSLMPCLGDSARAFFKYTYNETLPEENGEKCQYSTTTLDAVANSTNLYAIDLDYNYKLREHKYIDKNGKRKMRKWKYASDMIFSLYTKRGFPLLETFQRYAHYHFESGILQMHQDDMYHLYRTVHQLRKHEFSRSSLSDFKVHFCVFFLGYFASIISFIIEFNKSIN